MIWHSLSTKRLFAGLMFLAVIAGSLWNYSKSSPSESGLLSVSFLDVGQGDAIYIRAPNGNDILIDGGPDKTVLQKLQFVVPANDHDIDLMIATHPDKDHIAGLISVMEQYEVKTFLHSEISSGTSFDTSLTEHSKIEPNLEQIIARRGERFIIDNKHGVFLDILFPDQNTENFKDTNDASIVARLVYGNESFLLTGDSPISVEEFLINEDNNALKSNILKLGHHGSKTASSNLFLEKVRPDFAVVSAGKNNRYHHPSPETVSRVTAHHIPILSTIELGTITFESDGKSVWQTSPGHLR